MNFTKLKSLLNSRVLLILLIALLSFGQTLQMYFWQDDSALIFKLQNPEPASGSFGEGIIGEGPYKYLVTPFVLFFPLFGLEPFGYFFVGLLTFIVVCFVFYLFSRELFGNSKLGFWATAIFASGYVGSDIMFRVINSWQTNIGLFLALFSAFFYLKYIKQKKFFLYCLSFLFFVAAIEFVFIRSHGIIAIIAVLEIILSWPKVLKSIVRLIPFLVVFVKQYLSDESFGGPGISRMIEDTISGKSEVLAPFFASVGNILVADFYLSRFSINHIAIFVIMYLISLFFLRGQKVSKKLLLAHGVITVLVFLLNQMWIQSQALWYRDGLSFTSGAIGLYMSVFSVFLWFINRRDHISKIVIIGFVILSSQFFSYYIQYPESIFGTTHRYFSYSLIGLSIFFVALSNKLFKNWRIIIALIVMSNLILSLNYQRNLVIDRSIPSRNFYQQLRTYVPTVQKGDVFYFDIVRDPYYEKQFGDFFSVGSMPETTALAIYYGVDRYDVQMVTDIEELLFIIDSQNLSLDQIHSFYYGPEGLIDTSESLVALFSDNSNSKSSTTTPLLVTAKVEGSLNNFENYESEELQPLNIESLIQYLKDSQKFYNNSQVGTRSEWKYRETRYLADQDTTSVWQGHRIWWGDNRHEEIFVDLGELTNIGGVVWYNWVSQLSPVSYVIEVSRDQNTWQTVVEADDTPPRANGEIVQEKFTPLTGRYVKMSISKTATDDSPAMTEFVVTSAEGIEAQVLRVEEFLQKPFAFVNNQEEWNLLNDNLSLLSQINLQWKTDKTAGTMSQPITLDGKPHTVEFIITGGGTKMISTDFTVNVPATLKITNVMTRNLTLSELKSRELIKEFKEN